MEAIRKITTIKDGMIAFHSLEQWNGQEVEVIVLPVSEGKIAPQYKDVFFQFAGQIETEFCDTSEHVDELIYGK
ncbi:MAG: hypothetical protein HQM11_16330 [SAR324 cluster bacterium]|nr:hypothetical protein [SAR324 cluster bacterium]